MFMYEIALIQIASTIDFIHSHTSLFQVQATTSCTIEQTMDQIHNSLEVPYLDGPVILDSRPEEILVSHISESYVAN